jgi:hypothetical protein
MVLTAVWGLLMVSSSSAEELSLGFEEDVTAIDVSNHPVQVTQSGHAAVGSSCVRIEWSEPVANWRGPGLEMPATPEDADGISVWLKAEPGQVAFVNFKLSAGSNYLLPLAIPGRWCRFIVPFSRLIRWGGGPPLSWAS